MINRKAALHRTCRQLSAIGGLIACLAFASFYLCVNAWSEGTKADHVRSEEDIELATETGTISGTLVLPTGSSKAPVVLMIAGSGPTDRNGNSRGRPASNSLLQLSHALAEQGIATVRYDKRGVGKSALAAPEESILRFETYVDDAAAWLRKLSADNRFSSVVVLGHSEGSLIAMRAVAQQPASAVVSISGPALRSSDLLRIQLKDKLPLSLLKRNEEILKSLESGNLINPVPRELESLYRPSVQPYLISWFRYDPAAEAGQLQVPLLVLQGGEDTQVASGQAALLGKANPKAEVMVVAGMNHQLKKAAADSRNPSTAGWESAIAEELPTAIAHFIANRVVKK